MSNPSKNIIYSDKHPAMIFERLQDMVFISKEVCVRLEMITSPISLVGTIRMNEFGHYLVESTDHQSFACFTLKQVTSMGLTCIWITP
jgi:hypothetical protein